MKKVLITIVLLSIVSCGYRKEKEIRLNGQTFENDFVIWVYKDMELLDAFRLPVNELTKHKVDSLNLRADKFIEKCKLTD